MEWDYLEEIALGLTKEIKVLIRDAIEELQDHVANNCGNPKSAYLTYLK